MPRKHLIRTNEFPYHITNRSNNKEYFYLPLDELWPIFIDVLKIIKKDYGCEILQFVLMSNHYHLLLYTPEQNLSDCMLYFHRQVAKRANGQSKRINHFFGGRYKWCLINTELYFWNAVKYIARNPVEAQICEKVESYKYSSLNFRDQIFCLSDFFFDKNKSIQLDLDWLNFSFKFEHKEAIQKGLNRKIFKIPKGKNREQTLLEDFKLNGRTNNALPPLKVLGTF